MVNPVHPGGDNDPAQNAIESGGNPHVAVVEENHGLQDQFVNDQLHGCDAEQGQDSQSRERGEDDFAGMEAHGGAGVHLGIGMVHAVETPEQRDFVVGPVPEIHPQIEQEDGQGPLDPCGKCGPMQQSEAGMRRPFGHANQSGGEDERKENGVH